MGWFFGIILAEVAAMNFNFLPLNFCPNAGKA